MSILRVTDAEYLGNFEILCSFSNGETKIVDMKPLFRYPAFAALKDEKEFIQFGLDGTIFWANGADIAPEYLLEHGRKA